MAEYISREEALLKLMQDGCSAKNVQSITEIPAADVEPVRHGRWIDGHDCLKCPVCHGLAKKDFRDGCWNYCPNCVAKMDAKE